MLRFLPTIMKISITQMAEQSFYNILTGKITLALAADFSFYFLNQTLEIFPEYPKTAEPGTVFPGKHPFRCPDNG